MPYSYDKEELMLQLQDLADRLGRAPKTADVENDIYTASHKTFKSHFGSMQEAREAAGLERSVHPGSRRQYSRKELIQKLKEFARELGRTPKLQEIDQNDDMPSAYTYRYRFVKYSKACMMAGLEPNHGEKVGGPVSKI